MAMEIPAFIFVSNGGNHASTAANGDGDGDNLIVLPPPPLMTSSSLSAAERQQSIKRRWDGSSSDRDKLSPALPRRSWTVESSSSHFPFIAMFDAGNHSPSICPPRKPTRRPPLTNAYSFPSVLRGCGSSSLSYDDDHKESLDASRWSAGDATASSPYSITKGCSFRMSSNAKRHHRMLSGEA